jgi:hypothetical protein
MGPGRLRIPVHQPPGPFVGLPFWLALFMLDTRVGAFERGAPTIKRVGLSRESPAPHPEPSS